MRRLLLVLSGMLLATSVLADPVWSRRGWYQVEDISDGTVFLFQGPFDDKQACEANMPGDDVVDHFHCEYLETQPDYDVDD